MDFTEEMLDAIEHIKARREAAYWDPQCRKYYEEQQKNTKNLSKDELEIKGRKLGIELDKRKSKNKLIKEIENYSKKG